MKIKEITIEIKKSKNYQTYGISEVIQIDKSDSVEQIRLEAVKRIRNAVLQALDEDADINKGQRTLGG